MLPPHIACVGSDILVPYNPPPRDVAGHMWHHGDPTSVQLISEGSPFQESVMSASVRGRPSKRIRADRGRLGSAILLQNR